MLLLPNQLNEIQSISAALTESFQTTFDWWICDGGEWQPLHWDSDASAFPNRPHAGEIEFSAGDNDEAFWRQPQVVAQSPNQHLLIFPIRHNDLPPTAACAVFATAEPHWLLKLARHFQHELDQRQKFMHLETENLEFAAQVTNDFEELAFLRHITNALEASDVSQDLCGLAKLIVPLLSDSIKAQCLVMISATDADEENSSSANVGAIRVWHGPRLISDEACRRLVQHFCSETVEQAVVRNQLTDANLFPDFGPLFPDCANIRELLLAPIAKDGETSGWLLALNRGAGFCYSQSIVRAGLSHYEFGTGEASILVSAASVLATHDRIVGLFREKEQLLIDTVRALVSAVEAKDDYTSGHSERVALYGQQLARDCGLDETVCDRIYFSGLLHDVGKISIQDSILQKPSGLSDDEFQIIQTHPDRGWVILQELEQLKHVLPGVLYHHERVDGKGYPDGLVGAEIPIDGRILAVADTYDAMTSDRPYRKGMPQDKAEQILRGGAGTQWDSTIVETFLRHGSKFVAIKESYRPRSRAIRVARPAKSVD